MADKMSFNLKTASEHLELSTKNLFDAGWLDVDEISRLEFVAALQNDAIQGILNHLSHRGR